MFAISGYNGAFDNDEVIPDENVYPDHVTALRNAEYGPRADGMSKSWIICHSSILYLIKLTSEISILPLSDYTWPKDIGTF